MGATLVVVQIATKLNIKLYQENTFSSEIIKDEKEFTKSKQVIASQAKVLYSMAYPIERRVASWEQLFNECQAYTIGSNDLLFLPYQ